jgi:hypothetical protein
MGLSPTQQPQKRGIVVFPTDRGNPAAMDHGFDKTAFDLLDELP